ncbi:3-deoxy-7-phosphoheptulonate synthase [Thiomicrorhabdus sediminis]|uniref:Phospho-2-dehydro-3-deoxyheptonate aldolase n=1 Tax=Thiomicrorhabdus sediminis TaxID=2580412 RepID=A0A4P9K6D4_9GAMM|nr:3-deoxy-7-phosphoheptulonate synthase [Thiomicrorhabdus sediminis]QCU90401.1 3-deoxy-7-phosphoheptulonate synthase [Thiomicrorhabdus sediminis]
MTQYLTDDTRIKNQAEVRSPLELHEQYPLSEAAAQTVYDTRQQIHNILAGRDDRLLVVIGPCSIHDPQAAREYAERLKTQIEAHKEDLLIVMRVYFEKPRTTVGWKGLINDPDLNESFQINKGLGLARSLLQDVNEMGVPAATEFLDLISPQYIADLISWGAIGARTTESQGHRELASGLSCPVGFKNGTDGGFKIAVDAIRAANKPHIFMSLSKAGHSAIFETSGNEDCHVILRGGNDGPNYEPQFVAEAVKQLQLADVQDKLMIDCSHANSSKKHKNQIIVAQSIADQLAAGSEFIMGAMVESHLVEGRQDVEPGKQLCYGQSITDACIDWTDSLDVLESLAAGVRKRREKNQHKQKEA